MNVAEIDDDYLSKPIESNDSDEFQTPTNLSSNNLVKFNLGPNDDSIKANEVEDDQDLTLDENTINSNYPENNIEIVENKQNIINSYSQSLPQLPIHPTLQYINPYLHHGSTMSNLNSYFNQNNIIINSNETNMNNFVLNQTVDDKENQNRNLYGLYNDFKLTQFHFHSLDTFGFFIRYTLNLNSDLVKEVLSNHKIQHWIERNKSDGFVYNLLPKCIDESKHRIPVVRCELCKFYGHLSHNCLIKELSFKLYNVAIKSGACRCHICGQLGHPAEAGLCPYIACSFCRQFGHWNHMCPNIDKVSRTLCYKCQRYGHRTERCPDQWRQFDRISNYQQTPYKDPSETNKPVYCYQCAKKGHYGHNCPDFYRKYFIRDNHQLNPVYFFAGSSPFIKFPVDINENDKKIINYLSNDPIYDSFKTEKADQDPLELLELYQAKLRNENKLPPQMPSNLNLIFNENTNQTQLHPINMTFKKYIRKWSNWIIDFNWIFTLKFLVENLATPKLYFLIRNYPILDNFILHWMWWSYTLNKDLENFTKDSFRGIGSMPWLTNDINNNTKKKNFNRKKSKKFKRNRRKNTSLSCNSLDTDLNKSKDENSLVNKPSLGIKQRFEFSTKTSIFLCDKYKKSVSLFDLIYEKELEKDKLNKNVTEMNSMKQMNENFKIDSFNLGKKLVEDKIKLRLVKLKSKSMIFDSKFLLNEINSENDEHDEVDEDLENTIVYLEKEKTAKQVQNFEGNKQEEDKQNDQINQVDEKSIIDDKKEVPTNEQITTSVFDKFVRSFSNGQTDTGLSEEDSKQQQQQQQSQQQPQQQQPQQQQPQQQQPQQQQPQQQQQQDQQQQNNQQHLTKKENNNENLHKLIDLLKKSNKIKNLDQGLIMTVSDLSNDKQCPHLDSAPTVEQIETEILATSKNLSLDSIDKQKQSDSSDLIKLLLKIDKNVTKPSNPPSINIIEKLQEKTKIDMLEQSNVKLNLLDILKNSVNYQNDHGTNLINKILNSSNCTPINIDIVNQQIVSSSSSSSGSCLSLSSLSSISPQPSIFSSNSSPNSSSSSNSTTAKPNIDSSFSNSINSSKSNDQVSSSSMSLSSSSSSVSLESSSNKQNNDKKNLEINSSQEKIVKIIQVETNNQELSNDNNQFALSNNNNNMNSNNLKNFKNSKNYSKNHSNNSSYSNKNKQTNQYSKLNNLNRHFSLNNNNNQNNRSFNNSKTSYSSFNIKQHNSSNQFSNLRNFQPNVNFQQNTSTSSSSSITVIQNNKFLKSNSIQNVQENNYQSRNFQMSSNTNNNFNFSSTSTSSTSLHKALNSSVSTSQDQLNKIDQSNLNWSSNNSFNIVNTNQTNSNLNHMTSNETNNNYKNNGFIINKQINQRNQSCNYANANQFKQQGLNGSQANSSQNRRNDFRNQTYQSSLLQFQQIYNTNSNTGTSSSSTNSNSLSNSSINQKSNSSTSNSFISSMHKQSTNLNLIQPNYSNNNNNHNSYKKNQSNSFAISNSFNLRHNNMNSNYNSTNNNSNNNSNNTKKNYKKN